MKQFEFHLEDINSSKFDISLKLGKVRSQGRRQKECEFGLGEGRKENHSFGASISLSRALDWKIEVLLLMS